MNRVVWIAGCMVCGLGTVACLGAPPEGAAPSKVVIWPAGPLEVRVALPDPRQARQAANRLVGRTIPYGDAEPPATPALRTIRGALRIAAVGVDDDGRTLRISTDPHPCEATYVLPIAAPLAVAYDLSGVEVTWSEGSKAAAPAWSGWWPTVWPQEAHALTAGSAEHDRLSQLMSRPGRLSLRTFVALPKGKITVRLESAGPIEATLANEEPRVLEPPGGSGQRQVVWEQQSTGEAVELAVTIPSGGDGRPPALRAEYRAESDRAFRPFSRALQTLPWAPPPALAVGPPPALPFDWRAGDRTRGEAVFFSDEAKCSACHRRAGRGGEVGPDLSSLAGRDPAEIYREIAEPSALIKPDYLPYTVALKDGQIAVGVVRADGPDAIRVLDNNGKTATLRRSDIEELRPSSTSIMPVGLAGALGESRMRDLLAYLLSAPPP